MTTHVLWLLILFQIKHFLADYLFQTKWMLGKFKPGIDFVKPLMAHCAVHALFTFGLCWAWHNYTLCKVGVSLSLALLDFAIHFVMDRVKASPDMLGRFKTLTPDEYKRCSNIVNSWAPETNADDAKRRLRGNTFFWWALGFDQMVHHLTHYLIIWKLIA